MAVVTYSDNWCRKKETFRVPNELSTASVSDNATATAALNVACGSQLRAHFTDYRKLLKDIGQVEVWPCKQEVQKNAVFYVAYVGIYTWSVMFIRLSGVQFGLQSYEW